MTSTLVRAGGSGPLGVSDMGMGGVSYRLHVLDIWSNCYWPSPSMTLSSDLGYFQEQKISLP